MSDEDAISAYVRFIAAQIHALPLGEGAAIMRGALCVAGEHDAMDPIRAVYIGLSQCEAQLELIANPQMKLPLNSNGGQS